MLKRLALVSAFIGASIALISFTGCALYCKAYDSFHHDVVEPAHSNFVGNVK